MIFKLMTDQYHDKTDVKIAYRNLCKIHHPDLGGSAQSFNDLTVEYERLLIDRLCNQRGQQIDKHMQPVKRNSLTNITKELYQFNITDQRSIRFAVDGETVYIYVDRDTESCVFTWCGNYYGATFCTLPFCAILKGQTFYFLIEIDEKRINT